MVSHQVAYHVDRWTQQMRKGSARLAVLQLLAEKDRYGYELVAEIRNRTGGRLDLPESNVYPALYALAEEGAISSYWRAVEPGVPDRKYYRIGPLGRAILASLIREWNEHTDAVQKLLDGGKRR